MSEVKISEVIKMTRTLEKDHNPYGWPAVRMREMTALADEVEKLQQKAGQLESLVEMVEISMKDLRLAITEQLPYDEICNDLYDSFKENLKKIKGE